MSSQLSPGVELLSTVPSGVPLQITLGVLSGIFLRDFQRIFFSRVAVGVTTGISTKALHKISSGIFTDFSREFFPIFQLKF